MSYQIIVYDSTLQDAAAALSRSCDAQGKWRTPTHAGNNNSNNIVATTTTTTTTTNNTNNHNSNKSIDATGTTNSEIIRS